MYPAKDARELAGCRPRQVRGRAGVSNPAMRSW